MRMHTNVRPAFRALLSQSVGYFYVRPLIPDLNPNFSTHGSKALSLQSSASPLSRHEVAITDASVEDYFLP